MGMSSLFLGGCDGGLIYKVSMEEARSGATLPGRKPMIPMIHIKISHPSVQTLTTLELIYQIWPTFHVIGKLAEGSDKSAPMIGFWAQSSDMKEFLCPVPLLERKLQGHGWKSFVHLFHR
jgi:hypothetical protein